MGYWAELNLVVVSSTVQPIISPRFVERLPTITTVTRVINELKQIESDQAQN
jgi:hypothetical protein